MTVVLLLLAAVGGTAAVVYFVMDDPRRRAQQQLARLRRQREELVDEGTRLDDRSSRLDAFQASLAAATEAHRKAEERHRRLVAEETANLAHRMEVMQGKVTAAAEAQRRLAVEQARAFAVERQAFDRRLISYDELAAENLLLKTDLKNVALQLDHKDCVAVAAGTALEAVAAQRDQLGRGLFEAVRAAALKALTPSNYPATKRRVQDAGDRVRATGGSVSEAEVAAALTELHAQYERAVRAAAEREHQARLKEQIRDELRREREAQEAIEQAERERAAVAAALAKALAEASGQHAAEVDRLRTQLAEAEAKAIKAVSNAQLTKRGTVYVISNPGSFGRDVFKIGMTRRDEWMDRVRELGDASVPFPFDVHLTIWCEDAPRLEARLHKRFNTLRVNKVNLRKEFFRVPIEEIVAAVRDEHGEVQYTADAEALEFMQSQSMTDAELAEVEEVFATAEAAVGAAIEE